MNESGSLGEAGARLRALVAQIQEWEDDDSRGYDEAIDVLIKIKAELDALLSAPVVSPDHPQHPQRVIATDTVTGVQRERLIQEGE